MCQTVSVMDNGGKSPTCSLTACGKRCMCSDCRAFHPSIENFDAAVEKVLELWQSVLERNILLQDASRFLKMMVINIFSIHHAAERHSGNAMPDDHLVL